GQHGYVDPLRQGPGGGLVAHQLQQFRPRSHKGYTRPGTSPRKLSILAQEAVAGMDGINAGVLSQRNNTLDVQVSRHRTFVNSHRVSLIRLEPVDAEAVFRGVNGYRPQPQIRGGPENSDRDLGPVGGQKLLEP